ncbi:cytochrome c oxidase assembly protein [Streptomyces sp. ISL-22]|uniref:cytochrome c oxidase assembly protein n=1 Tax=unclassified Streptomyces TaxID=2593676 RepID=UPI001BED0252|nr:MULTISPECIES: cytochrome c oxidase assembly protein [unclassified Streptomyces]MBT2420278.1 cytochrome c oxidase assembly protein [Streptomyces sp. ISL-24]MBT2433108.1 cytochrome c oxidase assembly protein [Streptomyces sp. ISL-22]
MTLPHGHSGTGEFGAALAAAVTLAALAYLAAAARLRRRGDIWPPLRDASFTVGGATLVYAVNAPLPGGPFTAHMTRHLIVAMTAPLLLVLARPLTLTLRSLSPGPTRGTLLAVAHSRPATWLLFPPLAAVLDLGGLWLLHGTRLLATTHHEPLLDAATHTHVLAAGSLFTFSVCQLDPVRRRWSLAVRGTTLLAAGTAHAVLAKSLYATPPPGTAFTAADLHTGAQLMYYGGDLVEAALAAVLAAQWYSATGRAHRRRGVRTPASERATPGPTRRATP